MNFSIHIDNNTSKALNGLVKKTGKARNALINQAIHLLIDQEIRKEWPQEVRNLAGLMPDLEPFEASRSELKPLPDDPFS